jgi:hypothetical protein
LYHGGSASIDPGQKPDTDRKSKTNKNSILEGRIKNIKRIIADGAKHASKEL